MELGESWGPATWYILHSISFSWDERFINDYRRFFNLIAQTIPCQKCKNHFSRSINRQNWLIRNNVTSKESMTKWLIDIHNEVNRMNNKKIYTYNEVYEIYNELYDNSLDKDKNAGKIDYLYVLLLIALALFGYYYYKNYYLKKK